MRTRTPAEIESIAFAPPVVARFRHDYLDQRPVVLTGAARGLPALSRCTREALVAMFPDRLFPCYESRRGQAISTHTDLHDVVSQTGMTVTDFAAKAAKAVSGDEWRAQLRLRLSDPEVRERLEPELRYPEELFSAPADPEVTAVWLASPGSRTPIHRDGGDGLLGQIAGHKRAYLFPPHAEERVLAQIAAIRSWPGTYESYAASCDDPPACLAATLSPGDALYIPRGWFHDIDSIDVSASLVLRN
ncbi:hypothetical protein HII36_26095 [Nonomuraea sp. NN258]|uniref:cupin-like domain-containing protein n=1 Tax=Nonomuraea antri TaxID=2730852 RepID=UPI00156A09C8|nr:cupin-like domain-containing protein [Nonomuraea antri]NRQ35270.1 hypothetical protein [Nonomuraea antri]